MKSICVFLGSSPGTDPAYLAEDMALGRSLLLASFQDAPEGP
jgi:predicted Rossmann-fold nucleotide-binding protein